MKAFDAAAEIQAIMTICDSEQRSFFLGSLSQDHFGSPATKEIMQRITSLLYAGKSVPTSAVLRYDEALSDVAKSSLVTPIKPLVHESDLEALRSTLDHYRKARIILDTVSATIEKLKEPNPNINHIVMDIQGSLEKCHSDSSRSEMVHYLPDAELQKTVAEELESADTDAIPTGFSEFDRQAGGFRRKNAVVMASVPGGGKSAMALQCAINQYYMGYNVCIISYEMSEIEIRYRLLSNIAKFDHGKIHLKKLTAANRTLINDKFAEFLASSTGNRFTIWTPERELFIPQMAQELKAYKYDAIYVDYLGLLPSFPDKPMHETLGDHTRHAKLAAKSLDAAIVLLCQFDSVESKIKYSKAVEAHANLIWAWDFAEKERQTGIIEVRQLKSRSSKVFDFYLQQDFSVMSMMDYRGPSPDEIYADDDKNASTSKTKKRKADPKAELPKMPKLQ